MITLMTLQQKVSEFAVAERTHRKRVFGELKCIASELPSSLPLFPVTLRDGTSLYMRRLDLPTAVRLAFGVPYNQSLLGLFQQYHGEGWPDPGLDIFRTTVVAADGRQYNVYSQFDFSLTLTDSESTQCIGFHLVNADPEGLYGRMIIVDKHFRRQNLAFLMFAFQAEYASRYGEPGDLAHKKPIRLLKHKGHNDTVSTKRLLKKIGYKAFRQDPKDPDYWRVAAKPATILRRVKELGYSEKGVYF